MSVREINYEQNRLATNEICKVTWRVRVSVLIRAIPAIRPYLVALVIGVVLAIVGIPTRLSRLRRMTTATHECVGNFDMAKRSCERNCASIGFCRNLPLGGNICLSHSFLVFNCGKRSGCLLEIIMNRHLSWCLLVFPPQYVLIEESNSFFSGRLVLGLDCFEGVQENAVLESPSMFLSSFSI